VKLCVFHTEVLAEVLREGHATLRGLISERIWKARPLVTGL